MKGEWFNATAAGSRGCTDAGCGRGSGRKHRRRAHLTPGSGVLSSMDETRSLTPAAARMIVDEAIGRYFRDRHDCVEAFVASCYSVRGSFALHRHALGLDLLRAPANILLVPVAVGARAAAFAARRLGARGLASRLSSRELLLRTGVDREIAWRLCSELLELPYRDETRVCARNALLDEILSHPDLADLRDTTEAEALIRSRFHTAIDAYGAGRAATSELSLALASLAAGAFALQRFTPTVLSLGPALAGVISVRVAIDNFPLGPALGSVWYGIWPVTPSVALSGAVTAGLLVVVSIAAAFSGIVTDPVLRRLGLHRRRLHRMLRDMEEGCGRSGASAFRMREEYVVRLLDLVEAARLLHRSLA